MCLNKLIHGDCLEVLRKLPENSINLMYLDLPFFLNCNYKVIWRNIKGEEDPDKMRNFIDLWCGEANRYIAWLKERVLEMHRKRYRQHFFALRLAASAYWNNKTTIIKDNFHK
ncbi:MAG: hypothetical protein LBB53_03525 [Prevotellaceae bacterium]|jgi:DNA modification methylase|nr:hypothetical protein [Prevotellaceae bacterium]